MELYSMEISERWLAFKEYMEFHKICILLCKYYYIQFSFILSNNSQLNYNVKYEISRSKQWMD